jgi:hypothetical protein
MSTTPITPGAWNAPQSQWNSRLWNQAVGGAAQGAQQFPPGFTPVLTGQIIPINNSPYQQIQVALNTYNGTLTLNLIVSYNEVGNWWVMQIFDQNYNALLSDIPLLTGYWPAANILAPWFWMNIGTATVIANQGGYGDWPGINGWGNGWLLLWDASMVNQPTVAEP